MTFAKRLQAVLPLAVLALVVGSLVATQQAAAGFHYPREFGAGLFDVGRVRAYAPWAFLDWYGRFARTYPKAFDEASLWGLAAAMAPMGAAIAMARRFRRSPPAFGASAWARADDVRRAKLFDAKGAISGRVLGRFGGRYLTYQGVEHAIIVGASRSGKGAGHVVPTLVAWPQSVFVYDRKGELWHITADHRKRFSHVFYFAPTDPATVRWNPLFEVRRLYRSVRRRCCARGQTL